MIKAPDLLETLW